MKKFYTTIVFGFVSMSVMFAQQQFENPGFEQWENVGSAAEEPVNWSSLKTSDDSFLAGQAPKVIEQATGRGGTGFSVKMENKSAFTIVANGLMTNGRVHADFNPENGYVYTDLADARWNTPFTSKPDSLTGWYKYAPSGSDKGKVEVILHSANTTQMPVGSTASNVIARARFDMIQASADWKRFSVPFVYYNSETPAYILSVLTSGDSTLAVVGSVAHFDDLELIYNPNSTTSVSSIPNVEQVKVFQKEDMLVLSNIQGQADYSVYDALGRKIATGKASKGTTQIKLVESGLYLIQVSNGHQMITRKVIFSTQN